MSQQFKNYNIMCEKLGLCKVSGNAKIAQMKKLGAYRVKGTHTIIMTGIPKQPKHKTVYVKPITWTLGYIMKDKDSMIIQRTKLWHELGFFNNKYLDAREHDYHKYAECFQTVEWKYKTILETALKHMKRYDMIDYDLKYYGVVGDKWYILNEEQEEYFTKHKRKAIENSLVPTTLLYKAIQEPVYWNNVDSGYDKIFPFYHIYKLRDIDYDDHSYRINNKLVEYFNTNKRVYNMKEFVNKYIKGGYIK